MNSQAQHVVPDQSVSCWCLQSLLTTISESPTAAWQRFLPGCGLLMDIQSRMAFHCALRNFFSDNRSFVVRTSPETSEDQCSVSWKMLLPVAAHYAAHGHHLGSLRNPSWAPHRDSF